MTEKTREARPRGPNQPRKSFALVLSPVPKGKEDWKHTDNRKTQYGIQNHRPCEIWDAMTNDDSTKEHPGNQG